VNDNNHLVKCPQCGDEHELFDMEVAFGMPDDFFALPEDERNDRGKISDDFCQLGDRYFVRSVIPIPVNDRTEIYCWGVWIEVTEDDFFTTFNTWEEDDVSHIPRLAGTLANELPGYEDTVSLRGELELKSDSRPFFHVSEESKLKADQSSGITTNDAARYYHHVA